MRARRGCLSRWCLPTTCRLRAFCTLLKPGTVEWAFWTGEGWRLFYCTLYTGVVRYPAISALANTSRSCATDARRIGFSSMADKGG